MISSAAGLNHQPFAKELPSHVDSEFSEFRYGEEKSIPQEDKNQVTNEIEALAVNRGSLFTNCLDKSILLHKVGQNNNKNQVDGKAQPVLSTINNRFEITPQIFKNRDFESEPQKMKYPRLEQVVMTQMNFDQKISNFHQQDDRSAKDLELDSIYNIDRFLDGHAINKQVRARMVDWMTDVMTQFECEENTFFRAIQIMDRYFKNCGQALQIQNLHIIGVTSMYMASKQEDLDPFTIELVDEKISQHAIPIDNILKLENNILCRLNYKLEGPTVIDFLRQYLWEIFSIELLKLNETKNKQDFCLNLKTQKQNKNNHNKANPHQQKFCSSEQSIAESSQDQVQDYLIEKMCVYLAKMALHDDTISQQRPSLIAIGSIYVALKICESLQNKIIITGEIVHSLIEESRYSDSDLQKISETILELAQNFEQKLPGLQNLKKHQLKVINQLL